MRRYRLTGSSRKNTGRRGRRLSLPLIEERGDVFGPHVAHVLELFVLLREEKLAVRVEDGESGNTLFDGHVVFFGDVDVVVHVADVDVNNDEVFGEEFGVWTLVHVDVKDLAVTTPVATEIKDDALVLCPRLLEGGGDVRRGVSGRGVEMLLDEGDVLSSGVA